MEILWKTPCAVFTFLPFTEAATEGVQKKKKKTVLKNSAIFIRKHPC